MRCDRLVRFSGDLLLVTEENKTFLHNIRRHACVIQLSSPPPSSVHLPSPHVSHLQYEYAVLFISYSCQPDECYEALIADEYLVLLRTYFLAIYPLQTFRHGRASPPTDVADLHPVSWHVWRWSVDGGRLSHRARHLQTRAEPLLDVVIRFSSNYPWPTNILNHYILQPNYAYVPSSFIRPTNVPYNPHPVHMRTLSAPLRLFAQSDVAIGNYGTVLWIDTQTEEYFMQSATGQRLAGVSLLSIGPEEDQAEDPNAVAYSAGSESVFNIHDQNSWCLLAVDERNGRVALGALDGIVSVMDFAWPSL